MPATCPHCNAELGLFKSTVVCPFCGTNMQIPKDGEQLTGGGFWKVRVALALVVPVVAFILNVDRFLVLLLVPASLLVGFAVYAAWDRVWAELGAKRA
jgi:hypothetical protein